MTTWHAEQSRPGGAPARRAGPAARVPQPALDYYLVEPDGPGAGSAAPEGLVVEEFVLGEDCAAVRLDSAAWTPADGHWWDCAAFSRSIRVDADLRRRVVGVPRHEAAAAYRRLGGGELPGEEALRGHFQDGQPLSTAAPLRLSPRPAGVGQRDSRVYRVLFAADLRPDGLANLGGAWRMASTAAAADPGARIIGVAARRIGTDSFTWHLRRIGAGGPWCLDLNADLAGGADPLGPLLRELTTALRMQGLIPVTIERFS
ncbi:hypothetical protein C5N14_07795 [Micromonospora sp. MW-13]|uniref:hypothetical protein n=1 Tax=Micromonospora sp. MW-13 TaxID=2094022 RepID=UPI000E4310AC|nr:hypothetical protein [Micromonospora sp. MW-13]RGC69582.1 hypothetical protein C5N14_07795 [Micromonospora sp. MW-13]